DSTDHWEILRGGGGLGFLRNEPGFNGSGGRFIQGSRRTRFDLRQEVVTRRDDRRWLCYAPALNADPWREGGSERDRSKVCGRERLGQHHPGVADDPAQAQDVKRRGRDRALVALDLRHGLGRRGPREEDLDREAALLARLGEAIVRERALA